MSINTVGFPVACIVTDLNSGKSVKYPTVARNDFLGINTEQFSFQNGYLVQAVSAVEFKEIGQRALEQGLLPEASAEQVRAILSELQDTDNDVGTTAVLLLSASRFLYASNRFFHALRLAFSAAALRSRYSSYRLSR